MMTSSSASLEASKPAGAARRIRPHECIMPSKKCCCCTVSLVVLTIHVVVIIVTVVMLVVTVGIVLVTFVVKSATFSSAISGTWR